MVIKNCPIRMCIACRNREPQYSLIRFQFDGNRAISYRGWGRSYYLCHNCSQDSKRIKQIVKRYKIGEEEFLNLIKELSVYG